MIRDISHKIVTLRTATATGVVYCHADTVDLVRNKKIPKGDIFEFARAAAYYAAKNTSNLIPHCHNTVPIEAMELDFDYLTGDAHGIVIRAYGKTISRTGVEMEILTGLSLAALTIYDILKPIDDSLSIGAIKLLEKTGGKSDKKYFNTPPTCAVLVCSDSTAAGRREDNSGKLICDMLREHKIHDIEYLIVADDKDRIQAQIREWVRRDIHYIFTTGGTGLGPRDNTVTAVAEILERDAQGIVEAMRHHGQQRTPLAMMSRAVAGSIGYTTIVTLPGSTKGARECMEAILPAVFHARKMLKGGGH